MSGCIGSRYSALDLVNVSASRVGSVVGTFLPVGVPLQFATDPLKRLDTSLNELMGGSRQPKGLHQHSPSGGSMRSLLSWARSWMVFSTSASTGTLRLANGAG